MDPNPVMPQSIRDLSPSMQLFLSGVRDDEIDNLKILVDMRPEERESFEYLIKFKKEDLMTINDSLENLRALKRFGKLGMLVGGAIVLGGSVAAALRLYFWPGVPK